VKFFQIGPAPKFFHPRDRVRISRFNQQVDKGLHGALRQKIAHIGASLVSSECVVIVGRRKK
jgi:hypothetical protein